MENLDNSVGFKKFDSGKTRYALVPVTPLKQLADVYTYGAIKYSPENWRKGCDWSRIYDAMMRHLNAFWGGEEIDPESGLPHLAHAGFGIMTLLEFSNTKTGTDDRASVIK